MGGSLADRVTRAPRPHDPALLADVAACFGDVTGPARELLDGTAGGSPFLAGVRQRAAAWLREALGEPPEASFGAILDTLVGPVILAGSAGFDGRWRTYIGVGRIFGRK